MSIKYDFVFVDIELEGIFYATKTEAPRQGTITVFKSFEPLSNDGNLYLEFDGANPEMEIDTNGNLQIEEFDGMPEMYIDNSGNMIIEE